MFSVNCSRYRHQFVGIQTELCYDLKVHAAVSPPGFPLGRTRRAWNVGNARRGSPTVESFTIHHLFFSDEQDEEYFTLAEIKAKLEDKKLGWKSKFKGGLEKIEVQHIEENLECCAAKEEIRYDFTFYTPTCRYVRVKVSLLLISMYFLTKEK